MRLLYTMRLAGTFLVLFFLSTITSSQTLPVGTPGLEDYYRRLQLLGQADSSLSLVIRPLVPLTALSSKFSGKEDSLFYDGKKTALRVLPLVLKQQFVSHHPYGFNDGAMIPARGYQVYASTGFSARYKFLSVQLMPELVYATNGSFKGLADAGHTTGFLRGYYGYYNNYIDAPERFGDHSYTKLLPGQSSVRITFDPVSFGLSSENLWWGPGIYNSILMSNTAPGFMHLTLNTTRPIRTPIGSLEGQIVAGRLNGTDYKALDVDPSNPTFSGFKSRPDDWEYLSGMVISYQPKWVPGLFLGLTRSFTILSKNLEHKLSDYLPFLQPFEKKNVGDVEEDSKQRDQLTSVFGRWLWTAANAEVYFEFGRNDHAYNLRDFYMEPEHARAYVFGFNKLFKPDVAGRGYFGVNVELANTTNSNTSTLRANSPWYAHGQVPYGYTNEGQVLGAGIGPGGIYQVLNLSWNDGLKKLSFQFDRQVHNHDLYKSLMGGTVDASHLKDWVDYGFSLNGVYDYRKNILLTGMLKVVSSRNYNWEIYDYDAYDVKGKNVANVVMQLNMIYRF